MRSRMGPGSRNSCPSVSALRWYMAARPEVVFHLHIGLIAAQHLQLGPGSHRARLKATLYSFMQLFKHLQIVRANHVASGGMRRDDIRGIPAFGDHECDWSRGCVGAAAPAKLCDGQRACGIDA